WFDDLLGKLPILSFSKHWSISRYCLYLAPGGAFVGDLGARNLVLASASSHGFSILSRPVVAIDSELVCPVALCGLLRRRSAAASKVLVKCSRLRILPVAARVPSSRHAFSSIRRLTRILRLGLAG